VGPDPTQVAVGRGAVAVAHDGAMVLRHFAFLDDDDVARLFHRAPEPVDLDGGARGVAHALGATLYSPATRPSLVSDLVRARRLGVLASVICLEDSIPDSEVVAAQAHTVDTLRRLSEGDDEAPLTFVRVRTVEQVEQVAVGLGSAHTALAGFVLPKFAAAGGASYLEAVRGASALLGRRLWSMPVVETPATIHVESRVDELVGIRELLQAHRDQVLAVRTGATDLGSVFGLRRPRDLTVHDVRPVADALAAIVNVLGRLGEDGFVVTGPVWEYFSQAERLFKPQLRETPFTEHQERALRASLVAKDLDGLIREVVLDRANGLVGKTVIHPSHVPVVHALSVVPHEEYVDAVAVLDAAAAGGGVRGSDFGNKMNEANPHRSWAEKVLRSARAFGVAGADTSFVDLLAAAIRL